MLPPGNVEASAAKWVTSRRKRPSTVETRCCTCAKRSSRASSARSFGATVDQVALAAALKNPWADVVLSGAVTVEQLHSNVHSTDIQLAGGHLQALTALADTPRAYWAQRATRRWA